MAAEDLTSKSLAFKLHKVVRYVALYGLSRTLVKVRAQYHLKAKQGFEGDTWQNPKGHQGGKVGIVGCGAFAFSVIGFYLAKHDKGFLGAAMDPSAARARSLVSQYRGAYATTDATRILNDPNIELVYIASNHASHAEYAIEAIRAGKHVHIEKPHVVSDDQLARLEQAMRDHPEAKVFLGFNRPRSAIFSRLRELLAAEKGSIMINWFVAGHLIEDDHWYYDSAEGGRILGNLCHWSDLTLEMVPPEARWPIEVANFSPKNSKSDFIAIFSFGDGSQAAITFSAKGRTFEGVSEVLNLQRGDLLAEVRDFKRLSFSRGAKRETWNRLHRDHGHGANVCHSYVSIQSGATQPAAERVHAIDTARLFLAVKQAYETGENVVLPEATLHV